MSNNVPTRILYSAHKICGKKHAIGYIHEHSYFGLEGSGHFNFSLFILKLCFGTETGSFNILVWNRKLFRANWSGPGSNHLSGKLCSDINNFFVFF